jgi:hypothetical protein
MRYLITDTWNGEGYSDSDIEIREVDTYPSGHPKTHELQRKLIESILDIGNLKSIEINCNSITYQLDNDCQDAGVFHFEPLTDDILAVAIFPNICEREIIRDQETLEEYKSFVREALEEEYTEFEDSEIFNFCAHAKGMDESDLILREVQQ